jgi:hypothetical protein
VLPAILAATSASGANAAAHDSGIVRTVGAGFTGAFRALDLLVAAPAMLLPIGTRGLRAGLASAFVTAVCGAIAFDLAHSLASVVIPNVLDRVGLRSRKAVSPGLIAAVAAVAVLTALLSPAWQAEACAPGGSVTGVLLVLLALRFAVRRLSAPLAFVLGLAASYEPIVFGAALAAAVPGIGFFMGLRPKPRAVPYRGSAPGPRRGLEDSTTRPRRRARGFAIQMQRTKRTSEGARPERSLAIQSGCAFALGLVPFGIGLALTRRAPEIAFDVPVATWIEKAARDAPLQTFFMTDVGMFLVVVAVAGALISLLATAAWARVVTSALVLVVAVGALSLFLRMPGGPVRFAAPALAALVAGHILGTAMLGGLVVAIARARVPFAEASAALLVVLELVLPVKAIDETTTRRDGRAPQASAIWSDIAWGAAPPAAVILVADRGTMQRVASARAVGAMRGDLVVVPAFDVQGRAARRALASEPKLAPMFRDVALGIPPEELSLATLSAQRPVLATFDPKWERSLARHLVPIGLTSRFEPEPRGSSDRKQALDAFLPARDRLVRVVVAKKDAELAAATAALLRARAVGMAATGEREMLARALDDLRAFAPDDPVGAMLVRRSVTTKGAIDVHDLALNDRAP